MEQPFDAPEELEQLEEAPKEQFEEEDAPQEPQLVRIRMHGKTVMVPEDVAEAFEAHEAERQKVISRMGQELGQLRRAPREEQPVQRPAEPTQDDDLEYFQSPAKAVQRRIEEAEERAYQRIKQEEAREKA